MPRAKIKDPETGQFFEADIPKDASDEFVDSIILENRAKNPPPKQAPLQKRMEQRGLALERLFGPPQGSALGRFASGLGSVIPSFKDWRFIPSASPEIITDENIGEKLPEALESTPGVSEILRASRGDIAGLLGEGVGMAGIGALGFSPKVRGATRGFATGAPVIVDGVPVRIGGVGPAVRAIRPSRWSSIPALVGGAAGYAHGGYGGALEGAAIGSVLAESPAILASGFRGARVGAMNKPWIDPRLASLGAPRKLGSSVEEIPGKVTPEGVYPEEPSAYSTTQMDYPEVKVDTFAPAPLPKPGFRFRDTNVRVDIPPQIEGRPQLLLPQRGEPIPMQGPPTITPPPGTQYGDLSLGSKSALPQPPLQLPAPGSNFPSMSPPTLPKFTPGNLPTPRKITLPEAVSDLEPRGGVSPQEPATTSAIPPTVGPPVVTPPETLPRFTPKPTPEPVNVVSKRLADEGTLSGYGSMEGAVKTYNDAKREATDRGVPTSDVVDSWRKEGIRVQWDPEGLEREYRTKASVGKEFEEANKPKSEKEAQSKYFDIKPTERANEVEVFMDDISLGFARKVKDKWRPVGSVTNVSYDTPGEAVVSHIKSGAESRGIRK